MKITSDAPNFYKFPIGSLTLYFSYQTLVAFHYNTLVIHENIWGNTTGKHLNLIGDKKFRVTNEEFKKRWQEVIDEFAVASDLLEEKGLMGVAQFLREI